MIQVCVQDFSRMIISKYFNDPKDLDDPQLFDDPSYSMIPAIQWSQLFDD